MLLLQVCCIAAFDQEPYLLLGCVSGAVRVAALVNDAGDPVAGARQARGLLLQEHFSKYVARVCSIRRRPAHARAGKVSRHI